MGAILTRWDGIDTAAHGGQGRDRRRETGQAAGRAQVGDETETDMETKTQ